MEDRASDYTAIFAVESGEERDGWLHYLHNPAPDKRRYALRYLCASSPQDQRLELSCRRQITLVDGN